MSHLSRAADIVLHAVPRSDKVMRFNAKARSILRPHLTLDGGWKVSSSLVVGMTPTRAQYLWEQLVYGFLQTSELRDEEGLTPMKWARAELGKPVSRLLAPFYDKDESVVYPIALFLLGQARGLQLCVMFDRVIVAGGDYEFGIRGGRIVAQHSDVAFDGDISVLSRRLPGRIRLTRTETLYLYHAIASLKRTTDRDRCFEALAFLIIYCGGEKAAIRYLQGCGLLSEEQKIDKILSAKAPLLPSVLAVETALFAHKELNVVFPLYKLLVPKHESRESFRGLFGDPHVKYQKPEIKQYDLLYRYREYFEDKTKC